MVNEERDHRGRLTPGCDRSGVAARAWPLFLLGLGAATPLLPASGIYFIHWVPVLVCLAGALLCSLLREAWRGWAVAAVIVFAIIAIPIPAALNINLLLGVAAVTVGFFQAGKVFSLVGLAAILVGVLVPDHPPQFADYFEHRTRETTLFADWVVAQGVLGAGLFWAAALLVIALPRTRTRSR